MGLSCSCDNDTDDFGWIYYDPDDFSELKAKRRRRCISCKKLINIGSDVIKFERYRQPKHEIEENIYGEGHSVQMPPWYMCDDCGGIYLSLTALGYCVDMPCQISEALSEYHEMTGFKQKLK